MIFGAIIVLVFALLYWTVLPARFRPAALLLLGLALFQAFASSIAVNLFLILAIAVVIQKAPRSSSHSLVATLAILLLALNKYADVPVFQVVGLSYVSFRLISLSRDVQRGKSARPTLGQTIFYALFPPTFLSGPIEPYGRFKNVWTPGGLSRRDLFASLSRMASGLAKKLLLVEPLRVFAEEHFATTQPGSALWMGLLAYSLLVYLDFSAYSDLAIGIARLFGYTIGENFNWPYFSASISEFWTRWHISLSQFLRDHVFLPLSSRALKIHALAQSPGLAAGGASLITMVLCGMWHGNRLSFVVWGLGHGLLIGAHQIHRQQVMNRFPARKRMKIQNHAAYRAVATLLTFSCVTLLWVPFRFGLSESALVYGRLFSAFFHSAM